MHNAAQPCRAARSCRHDAIIKSLGEDLPPTERLFTPEPTSDKVEANANDRHRADPRPAERSGCECADATFQSGQLALAETAFAVMTTVSPLKVTLSTAKPAGTSDEQWRLWAMRLILFANQTNTSS